MLPRLIVELLSALFISPVRIINVASTAHMFGKINFDDLMSEQSYDRWRAYGEDLLGQLGSSQQ